MKTNLWYEVGGLVVVLGMMAFDSGIIWTVGLFVAGVALLAFVAWLTNWGEGYDGSKGS